MSESKRRSLEVIAASGGSLRFPIYCCVSKPVFNDYLAGRPHNDFRYPADQSIVNNTSVTRYVIRTEVDVLLFVDAKMAALFTTVGLYRVSVMVRVRGSVK